MPSTESPSSAAPANTALAALEAVLLDSRAILDRQAARRLASLGPAGDAQEAGRMIEVAALLNRVQGELQVLKMGIGSADGLKSSPLPYPPAPDAARSFRAPASPMDSSRREDWTATELLGHHDEVFVRYAYQALLAREPDPTGMDFFLRSLHDGSLSKPAILDAIRNSAEGRAARAVVRGVDEVIWWERLRRIPLLGYVVKAAEGLRRLPMLARDLDRLETTRFRREKELTTSIDILGGVLAATLSVLHMVVERVNALQSADAERRTNVRGLAQHLTRLKDSVAALAESSASRSDLQAMGEAVRDSLAGLNLAVGRLEQIADVAAADTRARMAQIGVDLKNARTQITDLTTGLHGFAAETRGQMADSRGEISELAAGVGNAGTQIADLTSGLHGFAAEARGQLRTLNEAILDQQRRMARLLHEFSSAAASGSAPIRKEMLDAHEARLFDALYAEFERRFRGARGEIKERTAVYLPVIRGSGAITKRTPLLDIGCGRGEWLELLRDSAIPATGIDLNGIFVEECRQLELEVTQAEALQHLRRMKNDRLGAITAMHVVEHLAFGDLIALLDESLRVLHPGGIAIFETPNPENLIVGACNFWSDPTHVKPLPPEALRFLVEARGFESVEVLRLHPYPDSDRFAAEDVPERLNELLYGPRDYAIIARKPARTAVPT